MTNAISIKGTREGLTITMATGDLSRLTGDLANHLALQGRFFRGGKVAIALAGRLVTREELERLGALLGEYQMTLRTVITSDEQTAAAAEEMGLHVVAEGELAAKRTAAPSEGATRPAPVDAAADEEATPGTSHPPVDRDAAPAGAAAPSVDAPQRGGNGDTHPAEAPLVAAGSAGRAPAVASAAPRPAAAEGDHAVFLRRNVRSGQVVRHTGHVVIMGDVNPGAEVWATGDVIVWGRLRGSVRAGAAGNIEAVVCALEMRPAQLRIGDCIARPADDERKAPAHPEIARARDGAIVVEAWSNPRGV